MVYVLHNPKLIAIVLNFIGKLIYIVSMSNLVSIIMPSFNTESFIAISVESIIAQTYSTWELIIVDDCSSDGSDAVINALCVRDPRIKYIKLSKNSGAAVARNSALEVASGRFIAFLDSDDLWSPRKLEVQILAMLEHKWALSFTAYDKIDESGGFVEHVGIPSKVGYSDLLKTNVIGCLTAVYDTSFLGKVPMPLIRKRQDFGLWLRLLRKTQYAYGVNEVLAQYRLRKNSISANKRAAAVYTWRLYRDVEGISLVMSCWYFCQYAIRGVLRAKFPKVARILGFLQ